MTNPTTDRFSGALGSTAVKPPVITVAVGPIALYGELLISGVQTVAGHRVLVTAQTDARENGIWIVSATDWYRAADFNGRRDAISGTLCIVQSDTPGNPPQGNNIYGLTVAEGAASVTPSDYSYPPGDVRRYGAVGDGVTDDYAAFRDAILQNESSEDDAAPIVSYQTTYYVGTGLEWCAAAESDKVWVSNGSIITTLGNDIDALKIGPLTYSGRANRIRILGNLRVTNTVGLPTVTAAGITIQQCGASTFNIEADEWYYGIKLTGDTAGYGCARNTIHLGEMHENYYGVALIVAGLTSFVNDNDFHGGYFSFQNKSIGYHIYIPFNVSGTSDSGKQPNHNTFNQPRLEGGATSGTALGAYYDAGNFNNLILPRVEVKNSYLATPPYQVFYTEDSGDNYLLFGWATKANVTSGVNNEIVDLGSNNTIISSDSLRFRSSGTNNAGEGFILTRSRPNGDDLPNFLIREQWDGTTSENGMNLLSAIRQTTSAGYHLNCEKMGDLVWVLSANASTRVFECIQAHTSDSGKEPGTAGGDAYWQDLNSDNTLGGTPDPAKEWSAASVGYVANAQQFSVRGTGAIWTNQTSATGAAGGVVAKMPVYDEAGALVGYIDIKDLV